MEPSCKRSRLVTATTPSTSSCKIPLLTVDTEGDKTIVCMGARGVAESVAGTPVPLRSPDVLSDVPLGASRGLEDGG
jgi:hypothetical protein